MKRKVDTPDTIYREQLREIGSLLRQTREEQQQPIEELASRCMIRPNLLRAIEAGDLENLPEPVYVRGLIRRYGEVLSLDGEGLASQFFAPMPLRRRPPSWKSSPAAQLRPLHLYTAYIVVMVAAVSGLSFLIRRTTPAVSALPPLDPLSTEVTTPAPQPNSVNPPAATSSETTFTNDDLDYSIRVDMTLTSQSWLRVTADGKTEFEGILQPGDARLWKADRALTIRAGNAGGVILSYNEGQAKAMGQPGMVAEVTYAPEEQQVGLAF